MVVNRLWAHAFDQFWYSDNDGDSWTNATTGLPGYPEGISGPTNKDKIYVCIDDTGIYSYNGSWSLEHAHAKTYVELDWDNGFLLSTWCKADDSLVLASGLGGTKYNELILSRPGPPGTAWVTEYTGSADDWEEVHDVHGTSDGSAIFAVSRSYPSDDKVALLERAGNGTWSEATYLEHSQNINFFRVRVVSNTEVYIIGQKDDGLYTYLKVWLWNGSSLSEEFSYNLDTGIGGGKFAGCWISSDGNDGIIAYDRTYAGGTVFRKTGSSWAVEDIDVDTYHTFANVASRGSNIDRILLSRGRFIRYDSGWVDYSDEDIWQPTFTSIGYGFTYTEHDPSSPPVIFNKDPYPDEYGISPAKIISFDITDADGDLQLDSVIITVGGYTAYENEAFVSPYDGGSSSVTIISDGYTFVIEKKDSTFPELSLIEIDAYAADINDGYVDESWSFTTGENPYYYVGGHAQYESKWYDAVYKSKVGSGVFTLVWQSSKEWSTGPVFASMRWKVYPDGKTVLYVGSSTTSSSNPTTLGKMEDGIWSEIYNLGHFRNFWINDDGTIVFLRFLDKGLWLYDPDDGSYLKICSYSNKGPEGMVVPSNYKGIGDASNIWLYSGAEFVNCSTRLGKRMWYSMAPRYMFGLSSNPHHIMVHWTDGVKTTTNLSTENQVWTIMEGSPTSISGEGAMSIGPGGINDVWLVYAPSTSIIRVYHYDGDLWSHKSDISCSNQFRPTPISSDKTGRYLSFSIESSSGSKLFESTNGGLTWTQRSPPVYSSTYSVGTIFAIDFSPTISNKDPYPDEYGVSPAKIISFDITDADGDLQLDSVVIIVDGYAAYENKAFVYPYDGSSVTPISDGYTFAIQKTSLFPELSLIEIDAYAADINDGYVDDSWSFTTGENPPPPNPYFSTVNKTGTIATVLKGHSGSMIVAHEHMDSGDGFAGIGSFNDDYLIFVGNELPGSSGNARVSYLKNGVWNDIRRARTITNEESYSSAYILADGDFLLGGTSVGDGHGIWRYDGPPVATKVGTTGNPVSAMGGSSQTNIWALDSSADAYQSTDGLGMSWTNRGRVSAGDGYDISVIDNSTVFVGTLNGVYSWDGGSSWSAVGSLGTSAMAIHAVSASEVWAAGFDVGNDLWKIKVWNGLSWTEKYSVSSASASAIYAIRKQGIYIYCVGELSGDAWGVYSDDVGSSWSSIVWPDGYGPVTDIYIGTTSTPTLRNLSPLPNQGQFPVVTVPYSTTYPNVGGISSEIEVEIVDPSGIDETTVEIDLNIGSDSYAVWSSESQQVGFVVTTSNVDGGKKYVIAHDARLPLGSDIEIAVRANNILDESMDATYTFQSAYLALGAASIGGPRISIFDGAVWTYPYYTTGLRTTAVNDKCFSVPRKDFIALKAGNYVQTFYNGVWQEKYLTEFPGYYGLISVWANSDGYAFVGGDATGKGGIWKLNAATNTIVNSFINTTWPIIAEIHGNGNIICAVGSASSIRKNAVISLDGGSSWLTAESWAPYTEYRNGMSVYVRSDGIIYAGITSSYSPWKAVLRRNVSGVWEYLPAFPGIVPSPSYVRVVSVYSSSDNDVFAKINYPVRRLYHFNGYEWDWYTTYDSNYDPYHVRGAAGNDVRLVRNWAYDYKGYHRQWNGFDVTLLEDDFPVYATSPGLVHEYLDVDLTPPELANQAPVPGSFKNPVNSTIKFDILDSDSGVVPATVVITVKGEVAWTGDAEAGHYTASKVAVPFGWRYTLDRDFDFDYNSSVLVEVYAEDAEGNVLDTSWTWYTDTRDPIWVAGLNPIGSPSEGYELTDRWNGNSWSVDTLATIAAGKLLGVWASSSSDVWMVGEPPPGETGPTVLHYDGAAWSLLTIPGAVGTLRGVYGVSPTEVYVCGDSDLVFKFDGTNWTDLSSTLSVSGNWQGIYSPNVNDAFMINQSGHVVRWDGLAWTLVYTSSSYPLLTSIHGSGSDNVWACSNKGRILRWNGSTWSLLNVNVNTQIYDIWVLSNSWVVAIGQYWYGLWTGGSWSTKPWGDPWIEAGRGIFAQSPNYVVLVGLGGQIYRSVNGGSLTAQSSGTTGDLHDVFGTLPDLTQPALQNQDPYPGAINVPPNVEPVLEIVDPGSGISELSVVLKVNTVTAWESNAQQNGFVVIKTPVTDGFRWEITPPAPFDSNPVVIDVYAEDNSGPPNILDTFYTFDTKISPNIINIDPYDGETDVPLDSSVEFDAYSSSSIIEISSTLVTIDGKVAWENDTGQLGYLLSTKTPTTVGIYDGYHYTIVPDENLPESSEVFVEIFIEDILENDAYENYSFYTITGSPPELRNLDPDRNATNVPIGTNIDISIIDTQGKVDTSTIDVYVDGADAYRATLGGFIAPYNGLGSSFSPTIVDGYDGYRIILDRTSDFPSYYLVSVRVVASDLVSQTLDETYYFKTEDVIDPEIINIYPVGDGYSKNTSIISFNVVDEDSGVDGNSIDAYVNGFLAFSNGTHYSPYNGTDAYYGKIEDGYRVVLDYTDIPWDSYEQIDVQVDAYDYAGNSVSEEWNFRVEDYRAPIVSRQSPANGQVNVPLTNNFIDMFVGDETGGSGLVSSSINVSVKSIPAVTSGSIISPFNGLDAYSSVDFIEGYGGYHYRLDYVNIPWTPFELIDVHVQAEDAYGNVLDYTYSFRTVDTTEPVFGTFSPSEGSKVSPDVLISSSFYDVQSGVDLASIKAYINDLQVYFGSTGTFAPGYDGPSSALVSEMVDGYDGYKLTIDKTTSFGSGESISVKIVVLDNEGN